MKRFVLLCILTLQLSFAFATDVVYLRQLYYEASTNKASAKKFLEVMERLQVETDPLLLCYKGMATLMQANYSYNPYNKLSYFNKGKEMIEKAVQANPNHVEIRFMRFCVQTNVPFFLRYSKNINDDKLLILNHWSTLTDLDLKQKIKVYMLDSKSCTAKEKLIFV